MSNKTAVKVSIQIMQAFKFISTNAGIFQRLDKVEQKQIDTDIKFEKVFKALEYENRCFYEY